MRSLVWRRLDMPGHETVRLHHVPDGHLLEGRVVVAHPRAGPSFLEYEVRCDSRWHTRRADVSGWIGDAAFRVRIDADGDGGWRRDGVPQPAVQGCLDVDLGFTPSTNTLAVRRLALPVGASSPVTAAWLNFPDLELTTLAQTYLHEAEARYRYESDGGAFTARLDLNDDGLVLRYSGLFEAV